MLWVHMNEGEFKISFGGLFIEYRDKIYKPLQIAVGCFGCNCSMLIKGEVK